jgi:hypothetical protein
MSVKERGCGQRVENGLYACVGESVNGMPIDYFLLDPVVEWHKMSRAPEIYTDEHGENHLVMGVGKSFYPFVPDFV